MSKGTNVLGIRELISLGTNVLGKKCPRFDDGDDNDDDEGVEDDYDHFLPDQVRIDGG